MANVERTALQLNPGSNVGDIMTRGTHDRWKKLILTLYLTTKLLYGHAILLSSSPQAKEALTGPDITVRLRFNSRIDAKRSRLTLVAPDGTRSPLSMTSQTSPDLVIGQGKGLKQGSYVIRWQVLAVDGHITQGELPFQIH